MISCKQATELVSRAQETPLGFRQRMALRLHLLLCDGCARFSKQMGFLRQAMRRYRE